MVAQSTPSSNLVGTTLGKKYKLVELLGSGGMAEVYRAIQIGLKRSVAIKVMYPHLARTAGFKERFEREARILASLRHPNIIQIFDFDDDQGWYYMVMEYVSGGTLTHHLQKLHNRGQVMPLPQTFALFKSLGSGLDYAHQNGMIHRDIKPENVLFTDKKEPVLSDFGIARMIGATQFTQTGTTTGTPSYMSPEQAKGEHGNERSDIYSLGVMLYEITTGSLPYESNTPFGVLMKHVNEPLPPPRQLNPGLPPAVEAILYRAMAKEPDRRYQTPGELVAALELATGSSKPVAPLPVVPVADLEPTAILPPVATPPPAPGQKNAQPSKLPVIIGALALVAILLAVLLGGFILYRSTPGQESAADSSASGKISVGADDETATPTQTVPPTPSGAPTDTPVPPTPTPVSNTPTPTPPADEAGGEGQLGETLALPEDTPTLTPSATATPLPTPTGEPATPTPSPTATPTALSLSGRLLYVSDKDGDFEVYLKYLGTSRPDAQLTNNSAINDWFPDWSADGSRIVFTSNRDGNYDLFTMNVDGSEQLSLVNSSGWDEYGIWEPGTGRIVFSTTSETEGVFNSELHRRNVDGSLTRLTTNKNEDRNPDWNSSGDIFFAGNPDGNWDIFVLSGGGGAPINLTNHPAVDEDPALSPDGRQLVFVRKTADTNGDGQVSDGDTGNIYVMNTDGSGVQAVTGTNLDGSPAWSPDGAWLVFSRSLAPDSRVANLYAIRLSDGTSIQLTDEDSSSNWGAALAP